MTISRRRILSAAVLGRPAAEPGPVSPEGERLTAVAGVVRDAGPHLIVVETPGGEEERLIVAPWATAWQGAAIEPGEIPSGATVIVRAIRDGKIAERIWVNPVRITGTIVSITPDGKDQVVELDCGPHRGGREVLIPYRASGRLRVRHPKFEPGYLFDAIGERTAEGEIARLPATSQPPYRASAVPPPTYGGAQSHISGTVVWSDGVGDGGPGAAYPMLERSESGCDTSGISCVGLPYLSRGSMLTVRNVCTGRTSVVPIVACGCLAGRFCDRCVECGTSPRGRIAELSAVSFVELGGELDKGCFNARVGLG